MRVHLLSQGWITGSLTISARILLLACAWLVVGWGTARAQAFRFGASNLGLEIPDGGGLGTFVHLDVSGLSGQIVHVQVSLNISGSWGGDLFAFLNKGDGHAVLLNRVGKTDTHPIGYGVAGFQVRFDDGAANGDIHRFLEPPVGSAPVNLAVPLTGDWAPDGRDVDPDLVLESDRRSATLSVFDGQTPNGRWTLFVADMAAGSVHVLDGWELTLDTTVPAAVVRGRQVFYNQSAFDGNHAAANADDDGALATDKSALLTGAKAGFANYTSYSRGLNGIMIDIERLPGDPTATDFIFRTGNSQNLASWVAGPAPGSVSVRRGAGIGGSDRVTLIWGADAVRKQWLEVTVRATAATGLAQPDVFYFGNAVGESGNPSATEAAVNATDEIRARLNARSILTPAAVGDWYDFNRDKQVNATDQILARLNTTSALTALRLITAGSTAALASTWAIESAAVADGSKPEFDDWRLAITRTGDGRFRVRPSGSLSVRVVLEMATEVSGGVWELVPGQAGEGIDSVEEGWTVLPPTDAEAVFFRLARPPMDLLREGSAGH